MIDQSRLDELKHEIGEEDFAEVAEIFLAEMQEQIEALTANPTSASAADFHGLKGSAANMGFCDLAEICGQAEKHAAAGGAVEIASIASLFENSVAAAGDQLPH